MSIELAFQRVLAYEYLEVLEMPTPFTTIM
jgi:hypothetical protein